MNNQTPSILALCAVLGMKLAGAQQVEPGVQTSSSAAPVQPAAHHEAAHHEAAQSAQSAQPTSTPAKPKPAAPTAAAAPKSNDRLELGTTQISGNSELPKVMYVVPWRRADPGDFAGRPPNSLLDEALTPVDRDVFRRQNRYYGALQGQSQDGKSGAADGSTAPTPKDEK